MLFAENRLLEKNTKSSASEGGSSAMLHTMPYNYEPDIQINFREYSFTVKLLVDENWIEPAQILAYGEYELEPKDDGTCIVSTYGVQRSLDGAGIPETIIIAPSRQWIEEAVRSYLEANYSEEICELAENIREEDDAERRRENQIIDRHEK